MPQVLGPLTTSDPADLYPTHEARLSKGNVQSALSYSDRNSIPNLRREEGMLAYTANDEGYWKLKPAPWSGTDEDWAPFVTGGGGGGSSEPLQVEFTTPSLQWEIFHDLGRFPSVQLIMDNEEITAVNTFPEEGRVVIIFQEPYAGTAVLRR